MKPIFGALSRAFAVVCFLAIAVLFAPAVFAQSVLAPDPTVTISKVQAWIVLAVTAAGGIITFCGMLAHFFPPTTKFGKLVSWVAFNGGKALVELKQSGLLIEKQPPTASAPPTAGMTRIGTLAFIVIACALVGACSFIQKEFGSTVGSDLLACAAAEIQPAKQALITDLETAFATALTGDLPAVLAQIETDAVTQFGPMGLAALKCDAQKIAADYEAAHASDAGVPAPTQMHALMSMPDPAATVYARAKAYASK